VEIQELGFRGQQVIVCKGDAVPRELDGRYLSYGIVAREDENSPIAIDSKKHENRWGTIFTSKPITLDEYGPDKSPYDRTTLTIQEAMSFMGYAK
jgi:hypothetical protein